MQTEKQTVQSLFRLSHFEKSDQGLHCFLKWTCLKNQENKGTVKPVLSGHSKKDIVKVLETGGSLLQV